MRLFNDTGKVIDLNIEDVDCIKNDVINRRAFFCNGEGWFHDATTINQLHQLYQIYGFSKIDKNKLINLNKVTKHEENYLWINDSKYLVSRRNLPTIERYFGTKTD